MGQSEQHISAEQVHTTQGKSAPVENVVQSCNENMTCSKQILKCPYITVSREPGWDNLQNIENQQKEDIDVENVLKVLFFETLFLEIIQLI